jgi:hypothetical protein
MSNIISVNKYISTKFINYIHTTNNLCLYKLGSYHIPKNVIFNNVDTLTLINCNKNGILNIFTPYIFPNLSTVNYISANPGDFQIYKRFNNTLNWVFPNKTYMFYDFMIKTQNGKKDNELINKYIKNKRIIDGNNEFDISYDCDLDIPSYGIVNGELWRTQFYEYLVQQYNNINNVHCLYPGESYKLFSQECEEKLLEKEYISEKLYNCYFEDIFENE